MKKFLLASAIALSACTLAETASAEYIPFNFYGFQYNSEASFGTEGYQRYVVAKMMYNPDNESDNWYIQRQVPLFNSTTHVGSGDWDWVSVTSCYMREGVLYAVRYKADLVNQISIYDEKGNETWFANVPYTNGYITHSAYVEEEDMLYMVLATPSSSYASLYKAPADDPANMTFVKQITSTFSGKPYSFTYAKDKDLFYYVDNNGDLYSMTREGDTTYFYSINPSGADLPSNESMRSYGSGLVWAPEYERLIWTYPREGAGICYWYGLEVSEGAENPAQLLFTDAESGVSRNLFYCMINQGFDIPAGTPSTPAYISCRAISGKSGWYSAQWPVVKTDLDGAPLEEEVGYILRIKDKVIATAKNPVKGSIASANFVLPHEYTDNLFYVTVQAYTATGVSGKAEVGPITSAWDPEDPGKWEKDPLVESGVEEVAASNVSVSVNGNVIGVSGLNGETAQVVALDGKVVAVLNADGVVEVPAGLYIVKAARKATKVIVK